MFYATLISLVPSIFSGYCYDIFGRKILIVVCFAVFVIGLMMLNWMDTISELIACRCLMQTCMFMVHSNPLVMDYVKSESRGFAATIQFLGNGIGEMINMLVLVQI